MRAPLSLINSLLHIFLTVMGGPAFPYKFLNNVCLKISLSNFTAYIPYCNGGPAFPYKFLNKFCFKKFKSTDL